MGAGSGCSLVAQPKAVPVAGSRGCQEDLEALGEAGGQYGPEHGHRSPGQTQKPAKGLTPISILSPSHSKANSKERTMPCTPEHM